MEIMVAYDASDSAKKAFDLAQRHAKAFNGKIHLVMAMESTSELELQEIENAERMLEDAGSICRKNKIAYETHVLVNDLEPGEILVQYAKDHHIEEIVVGIERTSKVGKLLFGSTAQYLILESPCPVATIK